MSQFPFPKTQSWTTPRLQWNNGDGWSNLLNGPTLHPQRPKRSSATARLPALLPQRRDPVPGKKKVCRTLITNKIGVTACQPGRIARDAKKKEENRDDSYSVYPRVIVTAADKRLQHGITAKCGITWGGNAQTKQASMPVGGQRPREMLRQRWEKSRMD